MAWNFCNAIVPPLILPLSLSLSLATRQKPREPRKLNSVSRLTFTANERIFFFSLSPSPSISYFYTKRNKRAIRGSFDSSIILTSPFRALDPPPLPPPCHGSSINPVVANQSSIRDDVWNIKKRIRVRASEECIGWRLIRDVSGIRGIKNSVCHAVFCVCRGE